MTNTDIFVLAAYFLAVAVTILWGKFAKENDKKAVYAFLSLSVIAILLALYCEYSGTSAFTSRVQGGVSITFCIIASIMMFASGLIFTILNFGKKKVS